MCRIQKKLNNISGEIVLNYLAEVREKDGRIDINQIAFLFF